MGKICKAITQTRNFSLWVIDGIRGIDKDLPSPNISNLWCEAIEKTFGVELVGERVVNLKSVLEKARKIRIVKSDKPYCLLKRSYGVRVPIWMSEMLRVIAEKTNLSISDIIEYSVINYYDMKVTSSKFEAVISSNMGEIVI
jgi:hypothetical protein